MQESFNDKGFHINISPVNIPDENTSAFSDTDFAEAESEFQNSKEHLN